MRADRSKVYHTLRTIAYSKYSHVQRGVIRILKMYEERDWQDYIITYYIDLAALYEVRPMDWLVFDGRGWTSWMATGSERM